MLIKDWVSELLASYSGAFNDKLFKYLGEAGYTGALKECTCTINTSQMLKRMLFK